MNAIRQFIEVKNNSISLLLPDDFNASRVEVIILPSEYVENKISNKTKKMLDERLNDYLNNPNDVRDFDELLDELENSL